MVPAVRGSGRAQGHHCGGLAWPGRGEPGYHGEIANTPKALGQWSLAPVVESLVALRGLDRLAAVTLLAELGDISRFDSAAQLMGYLGLVPSVHDSGQRRGRRGAITRAGNTHARRMLVEAVWS